MDTLLLMVICGVGYVLAYHTYGRFLAKKVFQLRADAPVPSRELRDGIDYVPARKGIIFGHHFTSIAGTGPIVGPAIGVIWGWLPAILWVLLGSIFMGAVHDFGALVVSMRSEGKSISEAAAKYINRRVRFIFFVIVFLSLLIVIAIFGVVIAAVFTRFPSAVIPVWLQIPIAVLLGYAVYKKSASVALSTAVAVLAMYLCIGLGAWVESTWPGVCLMPSVGVQPADGAWRVLPATGAWVVILLIYAWIASTLPVTTLLQPRDYINAWQLFIAMGLLVGGTALAACSGDLPLAAPALNRPAPPQGNIYVGSLAQDTSEDDLRQVFSQFGQVENVTRIQDKETGAPYDFAFVSMPEGAEAAAAIAGLSGADLKGSKLRIAESAKAPSAWPFLFVVIACGAISGFHSLVASGTSPKQIGKEPDCQFVGYGSMVLEGFLAVLVIICVCAGIGMALELGNGSVLTGGEAWRYQYYSWMGTRGLSDKIAPVVVGAANLIATLLSPLGLSKAAGIALGTTLMGVFIASFAGTTLDTSVRIQRYVVSELASDLRIPFLGNRWTATTIAVVTAALLAFATGADGKGAMILWPLFGNANQLLASLALLVVTLYLKRKGGRTFLVTAIPCLIMLVITSWAMVKNEIIFISGRRWLLVGIGAGIFVLALWMTIEAVIALARRSEADRPIQGEASLHA